MVKVKLPVQHTISIEGDISEDGIFKDYGGLRLKIEGAIIGKRLQAKIIIETDVNYSDVVLEKWIANARSKVQR